MNIKQLSKLLEDKINQRIEDLTNKGNNLKSLIKEHEEIQQKHYLEMAEIIIELEPVLYIVRKQYPHMNELFDTLIKVYNEHNDKGSKK